MKKNIFYTLILLTVFFTVKAQIGINTANPKAILDIVSDKDGILLPSYTTINREAASFQESESLYDTTKQELYYYSTQNNEWLKWDRRQTPTNILALNVVKNSTLTNVGFQQTVNYITLNIPSYPDATNIMVECSANISLNTGSSTNVGARFIIQETGALGTNSFPVSMGNVSSTDDQIDQGTTSFSVVRPITVLPATYTLQFIHQGNSGGTMTVNNGQCNYIVIKN